MAYRLLREISRYSYLVQTIIIKISFISRAYLDNKTLGLSTHVLLHFRKKQLNNNDDLSEILPKKLLSRLMIFMSVIIELKLLKVSNFAVHLGRFYDTNENDGQVLPQNFLFHFS